MAGEIASAYVRIRPNMTGFKSETESGVKSAFSNISKIVGVALSAGAAFSFGKEIVGSAAQLQKSVESIRASFSGAGESIIQFNDKAATALGISAQAGDAAAAKFGLLFKNMGIGQKTAADMTLGFEKLGGSLASIKGVDPSEVMDKITAAAAGNTRGLKQLGIVIDANMIKQEANRLGLVSTVQSTVKNTIADQQLAIAKAKLSEALTKYGAGTTQVASAQIGLERAQAAVAKATKGATEALTPAQKAQAIYSLATKNLADLQKQAAAHSGDLVNVQQRLAAQWSNLKDTLGKELLPYVTAAVAKISEWVGKLQTSKTVEHDFNVVADETAKAVQAIGTAFSATQSALSTVIQMIGGTRVAAEGLLAAFAIEKFAAIAGAIRTQLVANGLRALQVATAEEGALYVSTFGTMEIATLGLAATIKAALISTGIGALVVAVGIAVAEIIAHWNTVKKWLIDFGTWIKDHAYVLLALPIVGQIAFVVVEVIKHFGEIKSAFSAVGKFFQTVFTHPIRAVEDLFSTFFDWLKRQALGAALAMVEPFSHLPSFLGGWARKAKDSIEAELGQLAPFSAQVGNAIAGNISNSVATAAGQVNKLAAMVDASKLLNVKGFLHALPKDEHPITISAPPRPKPVPIPGVGGGPLTVGAGPGGASAANAITSAKEALSQAFKSLTAEAKKLGDDLTAKMRASLAGLHKEIQGISSKADVTKARENLNALKKEIGDRLASVRETIRETNAFNELKRQVAGLGTFVTPEIQKQMTTIRSEIGKVSTPQQIAALRAQMANVKREITAQLTLIKNQISAEKTQFDNAWSQLTAGADAAFAKTTQKVLAAMQVMVSAAGSSFLFGGSITQTPAEIALAQLQAAKAAADQATALKSAQDQLAADQLADSGATAAQLLADQKAVEDAKYNIQVAALTTQAQLERDAATKQLSDAQSAYQAQRDLLQQQLDQRVAMIQVGMANGTISAQVGMDQLVAVLGDPQYGIDMQNTGLALGGALYTGLQQSFKPIYDLITDLTNKMRQVGLLTGTPVATSDLGPIATPGINRAATANISPSGASLDAVLAELRKQTEIAKKQATAKSSTVVVVPSSANAAARAAMR